ncbi:phosphohistidine phosphatase SixA [Candidatus Nitrosotalea okcheonensis]|uniref:Putative enzyme n=1 Tax=Candidatus Nitrosotalea okcheonensis TaxID=1903276 RepID=A0A2H1FBX9_9ARCH|nr:phosphohistidine phosphatase SixA [Candidatus Nitrosotalea okcheonensis]MDE1728353.1 phosphohistidine phosphatase SixA [Nitrososphaerota archaeon]MDE1831112.1 phosphohistidine phosphatase SixA [Nitrososphaerota archaeon]MDE1841231.1 phosphohistidine phosphatase SixA [Nitrososphaerota archaeon]MDE1877305.1 phosphohistidine phosphatase SixA [Nitrososphaerota archaeon]SMH70275.1 putative enzyme [Candidatus Nitrosotalea okcheonensis]
MDLLILRHGEAGRHSLSPGDYKRQLTSEGRQEIVDLSHGLRSLKVKLDYVFTSPLSRAKQTAEIVAKSLKYACKIEELDSLKPEGNRLEFYSVLSKLKRDSVVLIVGHEPYLSEMISEAISQSDCRIRLKKAGLARIRVISTLPKIKGELRWLLVPKHLNKIT